MHIPTTAKSRPGSSERNRSMNGADTITVAGHQSKQAIQNRFLRVRRSSQLA